MTWTKSLSSQNKQDWPNNLNLLLVTSETVYWLSLKDKCKQTLIRPLASAYPMPFTLQRRTQEERGKEEEQVGEEDGEEKRGGGGGGTNSISHNLLNMQELQTSKSHLYFWVAAGAMDGLSLWLRPFTWAPLLALTADGPQNKPVVRWNHRKPDLQGEGMLEPRGV